MKTETDILREKVTQLKRNLGRQRWSNVGLLVVGLVGFGAISAKTQNAPQSQPQDLVVRSLKVVDEKGQERILLNVYDESGSIQVHSAKIKRIVNIGANNDGGDVTLKNNRNKIAASMGAYESGGSVIVSGDTDKTQLASFPAVSLLGYSKGGAIIVYGKDNKNIFQVPKKIEMEK